MKKNSKIFAVVSIVSVLLLLLACQRTEPKSTPKDDEEEEEEEPVPGEPIGNNTALFEKNFEGIVTTETVNEGDFRGFLARPEDEGDYPGVVMIHEWWGLNENIEYMAKLLASEGYNVLAIDLYDGEVAETSERAGELAGLVRENPDEAVAKMQAAVEYLRTETGSEKVASLGWCFGGGQSLQVSLNEPLDATVIYYGQLVSDPAQLEKLGGPVLGIFGSEDTSIPVESVNQFKQALDELDIENDINIYDGVGHAFANPSGDNYAPTETVDAWEKSVAFLEDNLK